MRPRDQAFTQLATAGVRIRLYPDNDTALYIHAKAIVADAGRPGEQVLVGSQNFSVASLDYNRELAILTRNHPRCRRHQRCPGRRLRRRHPLHSPIGSARTVGCVVHRHRQRLQRYNAADDENNVYVHSNQPYQTAAAGGYSHSYKTDGSGYALIYLNGPAPGACITVTVGGATCTTSD